MITLKRKTKDTNESLVKKFSILVKKSKLVKIFKSKMFFS